MTRGPFLVSDETRRILCFHCTALVPLVSRRSLRVFPPVIIYASAATRGTSRRKRGEDRGAAAVAGLASSLFRYGRYPCGLTPVPSRSEKPSEVEEGSDVVGSCRPSFSTVTRFSLRSSTLLVGHSSSHLTRYTREVKQKDRDQLIYYMISLSSCLSPNGNFNK